MALKKPQKHEFHITRTPRGGRYKLHHNGAFIDTFDSAETAADLAVRFAQENVILPYAVYVPR